MNTVYKLILFLLLTPAAFAQNGLVPGTPVYKAAGLTPQLLPGVTITFCTSTATGAPCSPLAQAYADSTNSNPINQATNPLTTDALGNFPTFYAAPGQYSYTVTGAGLSSPQGPYQITVSCIPGSTCVSTAGNNAFTGNNTHTGTETFANINKVVYADQQAGATADVQISNCIAALSSGGICDATGYGATTQTIAATVTIPANVKLRGTLATTFVPSSAAIQMFTVKAGATLEWIHADVSSVAPYTSGVILLDDNYRDTTKTVVQHILCVDTGSIGSAGSCLSVTATNSSTQSVGFVVLNDFHAYGFYTPYSFSTSGTGWINSNFFTNLHSSYGEYSYVLNATGGAISGNHFLLSAQCCSASTSYGVYAEGTAQVGGNDFNLTMNDFTAPNVPIVANTATVQYNDFHGLWNGLPTDTNGTNNYYGHSLNPSNRAGSSFADPLDLNNGVVATGTQAALTGTGACLTADITTQRGGAWAGSAVCTNTTGASTLIITPGTTAPNGWSCWANDLTTAANILRQSATSTTACTIAGTVNANDVLTFGAVAY